MSNIQINDINIYFEINGEGPPLVLLPGLLGTIESDWRRFIPTLAKCYKTVAVDLRGHGRTNNPDPSGKAGAGELDILRMADDLNSLIDKLGFEKAPVLGYSLGGCIGLTAGLKQPGHISALVMHGTKFFWDEASLSSMAASFDPETILKKSPRYAQSLQQNHSALYGNDYWKDLLKISVPFLRTMPEKAPNLKQASQADFPVMVSVGDRDQLITLEEAVRLFRSLPKGELLVLPSARHQLNSVQLEAFIPVVLNFFERALNPKTQ
jgi:pimeloyl-ACP methyl ester carboxylesterase